MTRYKGFKSSESDLCKGLSVVKHKTENELKINNIDYTHTAMKLVKVKRNSKIPVNRGWTTKTITKVNTDAFNVGVLTGKPNGFIVVDLDVNKTDKVSGLEFLVLFPEMRNTHTTQTPSGGLHLRFAYDPRLRSRQDITYNGLVYSIDIKSDGGYAIGAPSKIDGKSYTVIKDVPIAKLPDKLIDIFSKKKENDNKTDSKANADVLAYIKANPYNDHTFVGYNNGYYNFKRSRSSWCEFCKRRHDKDNTRYLIENIHGLFMCCTRSNNKKLLFKSNNAKASRALERYLKKGEEINTTPFKSNECYESRYVREYPKEFKTLMVKSNKNTGKTHQLEEYIKNNPDASIVIVVFRRSLGREFLGKFQKHDFELYSDIKHKKIKKEEHRRVIVQLDSVERIAFNPDLCVLDEFSSILAQLFSSTIVNTRPVWVNFETLLEHSTRLIALDADLTNQDSDFLRQFRTDNDKNKDDGFVVVHNKFKSSHAKQFYEFGKGTRAYAQMLDDIKAGKKVFVPNTRSKEWNEQLLKKVKEMGKSVRLYYAKNSNDDEVNSELENVNDNWMDYDVIINTSISAGVNFTPRHFDKLYGFFCSITHVRMMRQMLMRVRNLKENTMIISLLQMPCNEPTTPEEIHENLVENATMAMEQDLSKITLYKKDKDRKLVIEENKLYKLWLQNQASLNYDKQNFIVEFLRQEREAGVKRSDIHSLMMTKAENQSAKMIQVDMKKGMEIIKDENCELVAKAVDIFYQEAEAIENTMKKFPITQDEWHKLIKYKLRTHYNHRGPIDGPWVKLYSSKKNKAIYNNLEIIKRGLDKFHEAEINCNERHEHKNRGSSLISNKMKTPELLLTLELPKLLGFNDYNEKVIIGDLKKNINDNIEELETQVNKLCTVHNHRKDRRPKVKTWTNARGLRPCLTFINSCLERTYGSTIVNMNPNLKKADRSKAEYMYKKTELFDFEEVKQSCKPLITGY